MLNEETLPVLVLLFLNKFNYMEILVDLRWSPSPLFERNQPLLGRGILK